MVKLQHRVQNQLQMLAENGHGVNNESDQLGFLGQAVKFFGVSDVLVDQLDTYLKELPFTKCLFCMF